MKIYYSANHKGFLHEGICQKIPHDAMEISQDKYKFLQDGISSGLQISINEYNEIILIKEESFTNLTKDELFWRNSELKRADIELCKVQDSDPKAIGSVSAWRNYRKFLRVWPENKNFPNRNFRPQSPDNKE